MTRVALAMGVVMCLGCGGAADEGPAKTPVVCAANLGKTITVEGTAFDRKGGAELRVEDQSVWIDGLEAWPAGYYQGGDRGIRVVASGVLAEDHGLPVFVQRPGEPIVQGVPVPEGTDLQAASHRFVLKGASWRKAGE